MNTNRLLKLFAAALGFAAFSNFVCADNDGATPAITTGSAVQPMATSNLAVSRWSDIKDCTYDMRGQFFIGLNRLEAKVDAQIAELDAKRAAMKSTTDTKDWDFAMKEMRTARSYLHSMHDEAFKATPETWDQEKDRVNQAWVRTQEAYDKVKTSTTT